MSQGVRALSAIEPDDRGATLGSVPRCHPGNRGNKTQGSVQVGVGSLHTLPTHVPMELMRLVDT